MATPEEWRPEDPPFQIRYIWSWFLELHHSRHFGPSGPLPITYQDMVSWSMLTERKLGQFEIKIIRQLDQRFFYVLKTPNGSSDKYLDEKAVASDVAAILRGFSKKPTGGQQGVAALPTVKVSKVPKIPTINVKKK